MGIRDKTTEQLKRDLKTHERTIEYSRNMIKKNVNVREAKDLHAGFDDSQYKIIQIKNELKRRGEDIEF